jgi:hypothetical protein
VTVSAHAAAPALSVEMQEIANHAACNGLVPVIVDPTQDDHGDVCLSLENLAGVEVFLVAADRDGVPVLYGLPEPDDAPLGPPTPTGAGPILDAIATHTTEETL